MGKQDELSDIRWDHFVRDLAARMDEDRPDRYFVKGPPEDADDARESDELHEGIEWLDRVCEEFKDRVPPAEAQLRSVKQVAGRLESGNLRRGNKHLRNLGEASQIPLALASLDYHVSVRHRIIKKGERPRDNPERVRIGALTSSDLRVFADAERRQAGDEHAVRIETCKVADMLADEVDAYSVTTLDEWRARKVEEAESSGGKA